MTVQHHGGAGPEPVVNQTVDRLRVLTYPTRAAAGEAAGLAAAEAVRTVLGRKSRARVMFAAAPSQREMLGTLRAAPDVEWRRVSAFQMDEYVGLPPTDPRSFAAFLTAELFGAVSPGEVHLLEPGTDPQAACRRYAAMLAAAPLDLVCLGIGENGHLAFNDPPDADFDDPEAVKVVELSHRSRAQQVNDGCFAGLDEVPRTAVTVTIPTLLSAERLVCTVPGASKRTAVAQSLTGPIDPACPASVLRTHRNCVLYLDADALPRAAVEPDRDRRS